MGRISKRNIDPDIESRVFEIFRKYVASLTNPQEIEEFFTSILSNTEQVTVAKRLAIAVLIKKGLTFKQIDEALKVSISTVGSVQKQISIGAPGYKKAVTKILEWETKEDKKLQIDEFLLQISPAKAFGSPAYKGKSKEGKKLLKRKRQLTSL